MIERPLIVDDVLNKELFDQLCVFSRAHLQTDKAHFHDEYQRKFSYHPDFLWKLQQVVIQPYLENVLKLKLKSTFCFLVSYLPGTGNIPVHVDRPQCALTLNLCLGHTYPWPLNIGEDLTKLGLSYEPGKHFIDEEEIKVRASGVGHLLIPGQGIIYSGTNHPHWRDPLPFDNTAEVALFNFVPHDFVGDLT